MVSSTLKLGISILNGGNVEVQQVTDAQDLGKNGVGGMWRGGWVSPRSLQHPPVSCHFAAENAGLPEGQEGSGLLSEHPGAHANMQVGPLAAVQFCSPPTWAAVVPPPSWARKRDRGRGAQMLEHLLGDCRGR